MKLYLFICLSLSLLMGSCISVPKNTHAREEVSKIHTATGPEDLLIDSIAGDSVRLIISCNDHRLREDAPRGMLQMVNLDADSIYARPLTILGEPEGLDFHPHGISLTSDTLGENHYLYVVSHNDKIDKHYIYKYQVYWDSLVFVQSYESPLMHSPNSVAALANGTFYVTNDLGKRGSRLEAILAQKKGSVIYKNKADKWVTVVPKMAYPNGLCVEDNHYLYVGTTRQNKLFRFVVEYDGNLVDRQVIGKAFGGDNVREYGDELLIPAHHNLLKFAAHYRDRTKLAPSVIYSIAKDKSSRKVVYANDGSQISACATAVEYKGYFYLGQVFEPYLLQVEAK